MAVISNLAVKLCCTTDHVYELVQERHNSIANTLELCLSCTNLLMCYRHNMKTSSNLKCSQYYWPFANLHSDEKIIIEMISRISWDCIIMVIPNLACHSHSRSTCPSGTSFAQPRYCHHTTAIFWEYHWSDLLHRCKGKIQDLDK